MNKCNRCGEHLGDLGDLCNHTVFDCASILRIRVRELENEISKKQKLIESLWDHINRAIEILSGK